MAQKWLEGQLAPFFEEFIGEQFYELLFICNHLMLFQLQIMLASVDIFFLWIVPGMFASNSKSKQHGKL